MPAFFSEGLRILAEGKKLRTVRLFALHSDKVAVFGEVEADRRFAKPGTWPVEIEMFDAPARRNNAKALHGRIGDKSDEAAGFASEAHLLPGAEG